jgi:hypothetical protein
MNTPHIVNLYQIFNLHGHLQSFDPDWRFLSYEESRLTPQDPDRTNLFSKVAEEILLGNINAASYSERDSDGDGLTILYCATVQCDFEMVDFLLKNGASTIPAVNYHDPLGEATDLVKHHANKDTCFLNYAKAIFQVIAAKSLLERPVEIVLNKCFELFHLMPPTFVTFIEKVITKFDLSETHLLDYVFEYNIPYKIITLLKKHGAKLSVNRIYWAIYYYRTKILLKMVLLLDFDVTKRIIPDYDISQQFYTGMELYLKLGKTHPEFEKVLKYCVWVCSQKYLSIARMIKNKHALSLII